MNTNWPRLTLITFLLALAGLVINPNPALAQEPAAIPALAVDTTPPSTYFVVVGAQDYKNAPGLKGTEGGEYDCKLIADHLRKQGFDERHMMTACGPELVRDGFFMRLDSFMMNIAPGSTVFMIWIGHGGTDPVSGHRVFATVDGSFDTSPWREDANVSAYSLEGISPGLLRGAMERAEHGEVHTVFITDTARGGVYATSGGDIILEGPTAVDFANMPGVFALSPAAGMDIPVGLTRTTLVRCLARPLWGEALNARQTLQCYAAGITGGGGAVEVAGPWNSEAPLVFFPPLPPIVPRAPREPTAKIALISGGGLVTTIGATGAVVTFVHARSLGKEIEDGHYGVAGDPTLTLAVDRYNQSAATLPVWYAATSAGAALAVTGIALPMPRNAPVSAKLSIVPGGMMVAGRF